MREILFRGKRIDNGEWVEGYIIKNIDGIFICYIDVAFIQDAGALCHEVIPETVGQYTGLEDKNGTKIFEGDIVKCSEAECCGKIEFDESNAEFVFWVLLEGNRFEAERISDYLGCMEVIGNIHDKHELLEVANEHMRKM